MKNNSKDETQALKEKLSAKEKEIEKLTKKFQTKGRFWKIFLPIIVVIASVILFNKLSNASKQLEIKDQQINKIAKELEVKALKLNELTNQLKQKALQIDEQKRQSEEKLIELTNKLNKDPDTEDSDSKDDQIDNLTEELEVIKEEILLLKQSAHPMNMINAARFEESPQILYSTNKEKAEMIIPVIKDALAEGWLESQCRSTEPEYDVYRSCFRSFTVELHNKLEVRFGPQWFVATGKVSYCYMITTMANEHEEYFFRFKDVFIEVFKYRDEGINKRIEEDTLNRTNDTNDANDANDTNDTNDTNDANDANDTNDTNGTNHTNHANQGSVVIHKESQDVLQNHVTPEAENIQQENQTQVKDNFEEIENDLKLENVENLKKENKTTN